MHKRYVSIWLPYLVTDWMARQKNELKDVPFILYSPERGRMVVKSVSRPAAAKGLSPGMVVADCRAIFPDIVVFEYPQGKAEQLLRAIAIWCIRFTPLVATDEPDGMVLDCSGCTHLLGGDEAYLNHILKKLDAFGYYARAAMSDTITSAWAVSRYGKRRTIVAPDEQLSALMEFPPQALRLEQATTDRLVKLGLTTIGQFAHLPRPALRRRFGNELLTRIDQAAGYETEQLEPVQAPKLYVERLPCLEPICTRGGIAIAIERLLEKLCGVLEAEGKGLRGALLRCHRVDGNVQELRIGTNLPTRNAPHLFRLFELKMGQLWPELGFELFELQAMTVESIVVDQIALYFPAVSETPPRRTLSWSEQHAGDTTVVAELLDKITGKQGQQAIHRYLPAEHYWPERSYKPAVSISEVKDTEWRMDLPRPVHLLHRPELIEVTVPLPDYPPMLFRYRGEVHPVKRADGPERIEQEWWLQRGEFRDYYCVEDDKGQRYWVFRSGHYGEGNALWYVHGFFA